MRRLADVAYVLPIRHAAARRGDDLPQYLRAIEALVGEVIVVDGSPPAVFAAHAAAWPGTIRHVGVDPAFHDANGKVAGVRTGLALTTREYAIIADDDVRYTARDIEDVRRALSTADIVRPQNYFVPLPWHALLDEGRSLLARVTGGDWPGTLGVRRTTYERAGGYNGDVLFENLELVRTICTIGGTERVLDDVFIARRPPEVRQYLDQRVRQAYDEFARPARMAVQLALLPAAYLCVHVCGVFSLAAFALVTIALAEEGRRRGGATRYFPIGASLLAPVWVCERAVTSWLAVAEYMMGGARYAGGRLQTAATPPRVLRTRLRGVRA
jgi:hypothetical protein